MPDNIRIQDWTKEKLDAIIDAQDHSSYDSAIKQLLNTSSISVDPSITATESLPAQPMEKRGHQLYLGAVGSGKTTTAMYQVQYLLENTETTVLVADGVGGYKHFTESYGGRYMTYGELDEWDPQQDQTTNQLLYCDLQRSHPSSDETESMLKWFDQQAKTIDGRVVFLADGGDIFIQSEEAKRLFEQMYRHSRTRNIAIWIVALPGLGTLTDPPLFLNAAQTVFLHHHPGSEQIASCLGLSKKQREYIWKAQPGINGCAEILRRAPGTGWQPFKVDIPDDILTRIIP